MRSMMVAVVGDGCEEGAGGDESLGEDGELQQARFGCFYGRGREGKRLIIEHRHWLVYEYIR